MMYINFVKFIVESNDDKEGEDDSVFYTPDKSIKYTPRTYLDDYKVDQTDAMENKNSEYNMKTTMNEFLKGHNVYIKEAFEPSKADEAKNFTIVNTIIDDISSGFAKFESDINEPGGYGGRMFGNEFIYICEDEGGDDSGIDHIYFRADYVYIYDVEHGRKGDALQPDDSDRVILTSLYIDKFEYSGRIDGIIYSGNSREHHISVEKYKELYKTAINAILNELEKTGYFSDIQYKLTEASGLDRAFDSDTPTPASDRQLWALKMASGVDHRGEGLTSKQVSDMIVAANAEKGYVKKPKTAKPQRNSSTAKSTRTMPIVDELYEYLVDHADRVISTLKGEMGQESIVMDDPAIFGRGGKQYAFFGGGMGFAHLEYDKRNPLGEQIKQAYGKIRHKFDDYIRNKAFTPKELAYFQKKGCPILAMQTQNLSYKSSIMGLVASFMESVGIKKVSVRHIDD